MRLTHHIQLVYRPLRSEQKFCQVQYYIDLSMEKLLDMDSPSGIGDVHFCGIEVNPFQTSSISPSLSISPTTHDIPIPMDNSFFLPSNHTDEDISSPQPFWDHSLPPQCNLTAAISKRNSKIAISPAEIAPFSCNFRAKDPISELETKKLPVHAEFDMNSNIHIEPMAPAGEIEYNEKESRQFTPDFGAPFPALAMTSAKALSQYTFDMNAASLVFGPPLSTLFPGTGSTFSSSSLRAAFAPSSSRSSASARGNFTSDGIRKGKVGGGVRMPSKFCHICLRRGERIELLPCTGERCRKVTCEKCFIDFGWDYTFAKADPNWTCCHCRGVCPERAQCFIYRRTNDRRHQQLIAKKQQKMKHSILLD